MTRLIRAQLRRRSHPETFDVRPRNLGRQTSKRRVFDNPRMATFRVVLFSLVGVALETAICWGLLREALADVVMVYLLGVVVAALRLGRVASVLTSALSVA